jgi:ADP-heptose:LPS heptosyltransferase
LRSQTTLQELIAAIAAADLHVAPITGSVHIAAAVGVPTVVIYGGYEPPVCTDYPGNIGLYSPVECAPCWLQTPCPYGKKCLNIISVDQVEAAVERLWEDRQRIRHEIARS